MVYGGCPTDNHSGVVKVQWKEDKCKLPKRVHSGIKYIWFYNVIDTRKKVHIGRTRGYCATVRTALGSKLPSVLYYYFSMAKRYSIF